MILFDVFYRNIIEQLLKRKITNKSFRLMKPMCQSGPANIDIKLYKCDRVELIIGNTGKYE